MKPPAGQRDPRPSGLPSEDSIPLASEEPEDLYEEPVEAPHRRRFGLSWGWALLVALLLVTLAGAALWGPVYPIERMRQDPAPADLLPALGARVWPARGAAVANALMLGAAALLAARSLSRRLGGAAPVWVAAWIFGTVAFAYVFRPGGDLALLAATAAGFALVYLDESAAAPSRGGPLPQIWGGEEEPGRAAGSLARWAAAGALLALPAAGQPLYLPLLVPPLLAPPFFQRRQARLAFAAGAVALLALAPLARGLIGSWSWLRGATPEPGLILDARLLGWNLLYFLAGRDLGVLPLFLPVVVGCLAAGSVRGRRALLAAVALSALGFLVVRPFDFAAALGTEAIGNRAFLPLSAALWFLAARPMGPMRSSRSPRPASPATPATILWALLAVALAAPFLFPLWLRPAASLEPAGWPAAVSPAARKVLPYETSQAFLPGGQERRHDKLWTRLLSPTLGRIGDAESLRGDATGELLVGSRERLEGLLVVGDPRAPTHLIANGQELRPSLLRPDGGVVFRVPLGKPRAVHPTLWSGGEDASFYDLELRMPGAPPVQIGFRVLPEETLPHS